MEPAICDDVLVGARFGLLDSNSLARACSRAWSDTLLLFEDRLVPALRARAPVLRCTDSDKLERVGKGPVSRAGCMINAGPLLPVDMILLVSSHESGAVSVGVRDCAVN